MTTSVAKFRYHGTGGSLFSLMFVNSLLTIITLGFYSAWARNKTREFHYAHSECSGDRFAWHGTGGELFRGWLKATGIILLIAIVIGGVQFWVNPEQNPELAALVPLAIYPIIAFLVPIAINGARRYRLSRSSWRGIRFSFHGDATEFLKLTIGGGLATALTLGFAGPYFDNRRREFFAANVRFGSEPFMYDGQAAPLFREYLKALLLTIPTIGLYWIWYAAARHRHFWNHTHMRGARFHSTVTGGQLFSLSITNVLLAVFTLGIASPWIIVRTHAFWCDNIALRGTVDWATIHQQAQKAGTGAEGLAEGLDVDVGLGMGM